MIKLQTKEHLVYFMQCGMINLSHYDLKFVYNLHNLIYTKQAITTNQVSLFEKLIGKYKKQLNKHSLNQNFLNKLEWQTSIIESSPEFTEVYFSLVDGKIYVKCPFNKNFLHDVRNLNPNPYKWNKQEKRYESVYSTYALKVIKKLLEKNYKTINYCPIAKDLINSLQDFEATTIWSPTLVSSNNFLYIGGLNEYIDSALSTTELNLEPITISFLSSLGVSLSKELSTNPKLNFASQFVYETDVDKLLEIISWLKELNCDCILFSGVNIQKNKQVLFDKLNELKVDFYNQGDLLFASNKDFMQPYNCIVSVHFNSIKIDPNLISKYNLKKIIKVTNSHPISLIK